MFNKATYWDRREQGLRGQGDKLQPAKVPFSDDENGYPKQGQHLIRVRGKGLQRVSRKQARQRVVSRAATAKNYGYQSSKLGFSHAVNAPGAGFERRMARTK